MPSRRRMSRKPPPLDLDRELDEMYSSPITRPNLAFLHVTAAPEPPMPPGDAPSKEPASTDAASVATASVDTASIDALSMAPASMDVRPTGKWKIHHCASAQDGHSANEQLLYELLWRCGKPVNTDERLVTMSREAMAAQTRITVRNIKDVLDRLMGKLSVERDLEPNSFARTAATYRVYSYRAILERRRKAGMEWVTRANGVKFIPAAQAQAALSRSKFGDDQPSIDAPSTDAASVDAPSMVAASMDVRSTPPPDPAPPALGLGLRKINPAFDSAAVSRLWNACRGRIPDCTVEEVLHFAAIKIGKLRAENQVRNPIGLLLTSVPEFFDPAIVQEFRQERARATAEQAKATEDNRRYWRAVLDDPKSTEEERAMALQFVQP